MRMDHDPAPRSIFPRFGFRYWPKTVIRSKCSEWLLRAQSDLKYAFSECPFTETLNLLSRFNLQCKFRKTLLFGVGFRGVRYLQATDITRFHTPSLFTRKLKK